MTDTNMENNWDIIKRCIQESANKSIRKGILNLNSKNFLKNHALIYTEGKKPGR